MGGGCRGGGGAASWKRRRCRQNRNVASRCGFRRALWRARERHDGNQHQVSDCSCWLSVHGSLGVHLIWRSVPRGCHLSLCESVA